MQNRRDFLKTAALTTLGLGLSSNYSWGAGKLASLNMNTHGKDTKMKLNFFPYELPLKHVFTVATFSRKTTPGVQVEIEYDGLTGYGEASMPPYLGESIDSVMAFFKQVDLEQFSDPT